MPENLNALTTIRRGLHVGKKQSNPDNGDATAAIKVKDIHDGAIASVKSLDTAHIPTAQLERHALCVGDILVAVTGSNPKVTVVKTSHAGCVVNQGLAVLSPNDTATGKRVADFLASEAGQSALRSLQTGVTIASIKTVELGVLAVP